MKEKWVVAARVLQTPSCGRKAELQVSIKRAIQTLGPLRTESGTEAK